MKKSYSKKASSTDIVKLPIAPTSLDAEQSILGGLLLNNDAWDKVNETIVADDFYSRSHKQIYARIGKLIESGQPVDLVTLSECLDADNELDDIGGFIYLAEIMRNTPSAANIAAYAKIVREKALLRQLISVGNHISESGYEPQGREVTELIQIAEDKVMKIAEQRTSSMGGPESINAVLERTVDRIESLISQPQNGVTGLSTGFINLDKMTAGLQPSDLIIVAARPAMGKTTFAMNLAENAALSAEKPVLIFSLEMPSEQLMMRMFASLGRISQTKLKTGALDDEDWSRLSSTMGLLMDSGKMYIDDSSGLTPSDVRTRARRVHREHGGLSMVMIDYLQLMRVPALNNNRTLEIAEISRSLKALAKDLNVPVVALSQLNRTLEQRQNKRPVPSDLRESGAIEQDADIIMFLYRDEVYEPNSQFKNMAEVIIGKQRNGPIGTTYLTFQGQYSRFDNYAGDESQFEQ